MNNIKGRGEYDRPDVLMYKMNNFYNKKTPDIFNGVRGGETTDALKDFLIKCESLETYC